MAMACNENTLRTGNGLGIDMSFEGQSCLKKGKIARRRKYFAAASRSEESRIELRSNFVSSSVDTYAIYEI